MDAGLRVMTREEYQEVGEKEAVGFPVLLDEFCATAAG
jgi:hypothetical protein